jgi:hypothetical protein
MALKTKQQIPAKSKFLHGLVLNAPSLASGPFQRRPDRLTTS